jgi:hypothetical protein
MGVLVRWCSENALSTMNEARKFDLENLDLRKSTLSRVKLKNMDQDQAEIYGPQGNEKHLNSDLERQSAQNKWGTI